MAKKKETTVDSGSFPLECYNVVLKKVVPIKEGTATINKTKRNSFMLKGIHIDKNDKEHKVTGLISKEKAEYFISSGLAKEI